MTKLMFFARTELTLHPNQGYHRFMNIRITLSGQIAPQLLV